MGMFLICSCWMVVPTVVFVTSTRGASLVTVMVSEIFELCRVKLIGRRRAQQQADVGGGRRREAVEARRDRVVAGRQVEDPVGAVGVGDVEELEAGVLVRGLDGDAGQGSLVGAFDGAGDPAGGDVGLSQGRAGQGEGQQQGGQGTNPRPRANGAHAHHE